VLDCPDPSAATPRRAVTNTPLQALSLLNNAFVEHYAARFAERLERECGADAEARLRRGFALAFGRPAAEEEVALGARLAADRGLAQFCLVLFNASEFSYID
jgi:hypothetical protein